MAEVIWSRRALADISAITSYIGQFSPLAAQRMALRLLEAGNSLADHPHRGRLGLRSRRELAVVPPYVIHYLAERDTVGILSVRHGARRPLA